MSMNRIEGLWQIIEDKYGHQIQKGEIQDIKNGLAGIVELEDALSSFRLNKAGTPPSLFTPHISDEARE